MIYDFNDLTIGQLKKLTNEFLRQNLNFKTPQELLDNLEKCKEGIFE